MITNYLFDWDGTLAKTLDVWFDAYKLLLKDRNIVLKNDSDIVKKAFGKWEEGLIALGIVDSGIAIKQLLEIGNSNLINSELYPNVVEVLTKLKEQNKKIALITSSPSELLLPVLKKNNLDKYFDHIVTRYDVKEGKPNPESAFKALDAINGKAQESLIIGDTESDILTGKNANIKTVLYLPDHNLKFYEKEYLNSFKPDYVIDDLLLILSI
jgi:pyrophosphatase PpaX